MTTARGAKRRRWWYPVAAALALAGVALVAVIALGDRGGNRVSAGGSLPNTQDYHALLVAPESSERLTLGTHDGLFSSADGGRTWSRASLTGQDAMNLAQPGGGTMWAAGHDVLARSPDGGATWQDVRPDGLPGLDLHAFAVDAADDETLHTAVAGRGIYRSTDGGASFTLVTEDFGASVMALASLPDGRLLAGDMERRGLFASSDGGRTWEPILQAQILGIAVNPARPQRVLASGPGVLLSTDAGRTWSQALALAEGSGPIAWSPSNPRVAYVVGFDRVLYRTDDGGTTWIPVFTGEGE